MDTLEPKINLGSMQRAAGAKQAGGWYGLQRQFMEVTRAQLIGYRVCAVGDIIEIFPDGRDPVTGKPQAMPIMPVDPYLRTSQAQRLMFGTVQGRGLVAYDKIREKDTRGKGRWVQVPFTCGKPHPGPATVELGPTPNLGEVLGIKRPCDHVEKVVEESAGETIEKQQLNVRQQAERATGKPQREARM